MSHANNTFISSTTTRLEATLVGTTLGSMMAKAKNIYDIHDIHAV